MSYGQDEKGPDGEMSQVHKTDRSPEWGGVGGEDHACKYFMHCSLCIVHVKVFCNVK